MANQPPSKSSREVSPITSRNAKIVFVTLILLLFATAATSVYAGYTSGEIQRSIIEPYKAAKEERKRLKEEKLKADAEKERLEEEARINALEQNNVINESNTKSQSGSTIKVNINGNEKTYQDNNYDYEQSKQALDEWSAQNKKEFDLKSEESQKALEDFKARSEADYEAAVLEGQQGLEDFRAESEARTQAFKEEHGIE